MLFAKHVNDRNPLLTITDVGNIGGKDCYMSAAFASAQVAAENMDLTCINTVRTLSMDAVQAANSGHPGTPMAMAPRSSNY